MIIVFGGSFNPPTIAHYEIAKHLCNLSFCHQFLFLPVGNQYPKAELIEGFHRVKMLELICEHLEKAKVCTLEVDDTKVLTTYETLTKLRKQNPTKDIGFVLGADNLSKLTAWSQFQKLIKEFKIIVFKRDDINVEEIIEEQFKLFQKQFVILEAFEEMKVSSSLYRSNIQNEHLVMKEISQYIKSEGLYGRK